MFFVVHSRIIDMQERIYIILVIACGLCYGLRNPGLKTRVTQKGLTYATDVAIKGLTDNIKGQKIPDQSGSSGHVQYTLSSMDITEFTAPTSSVTINSGTGLKWTASGTGIRMNGKFHYKYKKGWIKYSDGGRFDLNIGNMNFDVGVIIGKDQTGRPNIKSGSCSSSVGSVHIKFSGGLSWIYNLFRGTVEKSMKNQFNKKMCSILTSYINNNAEKSLAKLKVMVNLGKYFQLDYRFVSPPLYKAGLMETYHKGEVYWTQHQNEAPFSAPSMPTSGGSDRMFYIWISDYVFNTVAYTAQTHGLLTYNFTQKDLPADKKGYLNATCNGTCIGKFIPQIPTKYPGSTVEMELTSSKTPQMTTRNKTISVFSTGQIIFNARLPKGNKAYLMTVMANMTSSVSLTIKQEKLYAQVLDLVFKVHVAKSDIGNINEAKLQLLVDVALQLFVKQKLNDLGGRGFPLPVTDNVHFVNTQLNLEQDTLMISTDIKYN